MISIIIGTSIVTLIIMGGVWCRNVEKKEWNKGICSKCGKEWRLYAVDSQGGRMYSCENRHNCDISYRVDTKEE